MAWQARTVDEEGDLRELAMGRGLKKAVSAQHDEVLGIFFPERAAGLPVDLRRLRSSPAV